MIDDLIADSGGRIVKSMGDGLLIEFASVVDATLCAVAFQNAMVARNAGIAEVSALRFRIGVHLGDVIVEDEDLFGDGVNVAARIEALADADGVALSEDAYRQVRDRCDIAWQFGGEYQVKNISRPVSVWRWVPDGRAIQPRPATLAEATAPLTGPSLAVLPFNNMSQDSAQEYFADGLAEDITTELYRVPNLLVISRNSSFKYKGKPMTATEISRDLGARFLLDGSCRKAGDRVRVTARLVDGQSDRQLWADRYDRDLRDIFAVQDDVTRQIVQALEQALATEIAPPDRIDSNDDFKAYDLVLRARQQFRLYTRESHIEARRCFEAACRIDPDYAPAYAGLALTALHEWSSGAEDALDRAYEFAKTAQALSPTRPAVYEALGNISLFRGDHQSGVDAACQWVRVEPGSADAYANLAAAHHMNGDHQAVLPLVDKAIRLNPHYPFYYVFYIGMALLALGRFEDALGPIERAISRNPEALPPRVFQAACLGHLGRVKAAQDALEAALRIKPDFSAAFARRLWAYRNPADSEGIISDLRKAGLDEPAT
ncbi:MAG: adenylate/guanylate cyclase domain-containing protein [Rhodospirillales bacterium]